ncbi:MAG TPA: ABC transporter permease [Longimicrobiaceae bacterium]|nr:ABC transporter permease [Longimicrobiaceae bacterium]
MSWLDVKLGVRMLIKHPGLTLIGGLGMAFAIAIGAGFFGFFYSYLNPTLPLPEGDRVVAVQNWDAAENEDEPRSLHDFVTWREELRSVEDLGAFRTISRNLILPDAQAEPVDVAEMTAAGFRVARVPPLMGRHLVPDDEREGAPAVVVIGYDVWRTRFASDPNVVGRSLQLGDTRYTVVGVMPEGFAFPVDHRLWTPLRADPSVYERRKGPSIGVFGRLAPGATLEQAQAELTMIGQRTAAAFPETHQRLRPRVLSYTAAFGLNEGDFRDAAIIQLLVTLVLVVICANVAILVYARTAMRLGEITVRSALGASRRRIVAQLFTEALVLTAAAAVVGLVLIGFALRKVNLVMDEEVGGLPFWVDFGISSVTLLGVVGLAILAAVIAGVLPAVQATGRRMQARLRQMGGGTGMQLGKTWTALVVAQVAFAVFILPGAISEAWDSIRYGTAEPGFAAEEFLSAQLVMDLKTPPTTEAEAYRRDFDARYGELQAELVRRLEAEPSVAEVTFALHSPGQEPKVRVEVEGAPTPGSAPGAAAGSGSSVGHEARSGRVDIDFFDVFDTAILTGRRFNPGDLSAASTAVVVNRSFVQQVLGGGSALGRRVRYVGRGGDAPDDLELGRWYEIVGVVSDFPNAMDPTGVEARLYHPVGPGQVYPATFALRVRGGDPAGFTRRLREITTRLDATLRLQEVLPLDEVLRRQQLALRLMAWGIGLVTLSVVLLSAAGIYALVSFTVTRRRREIGIRSALGAPPRLIVRSVFSRALGQLVVGIVLGVAAAALLESAAGGALMDGKGPVLLPAVSALMVVVGLAAALGPARRSLRIQPTEALREG